jgi:hypothetical protein
MNDLRSLVDGMLVAGILISGFSGALFAVRSSESPTAESETRMPGVPLVSLKKAA